MHVFPPRTFKRAQDIRIESAAVLARMGTEAERMTPNDALRLARQLLIAVESYGIQSSDFQCPEVVQDYVGQAVKALQDLWLG